MSDVEPGRRLRALIDAGRAELPLPGRGRTLERWSALATVAAVDLSLVKLFEGHTDAMAILADAGGVAVPRGTSSAAPAYGMWAAEPPGARVAFRASDEDTVALYGVKAWCSGAAALDRALLTVWPDEGAHADPNEGPWLADVDLRQAGVTIDASRWKAVGMADSASASVRFDAVPARLVGPAGFYLSRPGFWQGGIGIAACWHGASCAIANALVAQARAAAVASSGTGANAAGDPGWHRALALGDMDRLLSANAALLREAAAWIDRHPDRDARVWALRTRASSDECAQQVLRAATRAMGAGPLCHDERLARLAADLPVFIRQCHGDRDLAALGQELSQQADTTWTL
ncbi:acyl-CoA dehydrogenase [Roseateles sp. L2-2]|uniref:acyl-CoA dehydrogenase n=1 Tax=Roseateles sp. L2-2 TaxID=3422597 RepID=UPI003D36554F